MSKTLDFNTLAPQVLTLVMRDDAKTRIDVGVPTEHLVEKLQRVAPHLVRAVNSGEQVENRELYELAAHLISCNHNGITVTAEELRDNYRMNLEMMVAFYNAYVGFINEITNEKN